MTGRVLTMIGATALALALSSWQASTASATPFDVLPPPAARAFPGNQTAVAAQIGGGFHLLGHASGTTLHDASSYEIWLLGNRSHGREILQVVKGSLHRAADQVRQISGVSLRVRVSMSGGTAPIGGVAPRPGQIVVSLGTADMCSGKHRPAGCTTTLIESNAATGLATVVSARTVINNREVRAYSRYHQDNVVAHELGHALGLDEFNVLYGGRAQVMNAGNYSAGGIYRAGDRNGLVALRPVG